MRIGYFTDTYLPQISGVSTYIDFIFRNLLKRGYQVDLVAPKFPNHKDKHNVIRLISIPANRAFNYRFAIYTPLNIFIKLLTTDFDLIHGHANGTISLMGLILAKVKRVPYVYTYHTMLKDYSHYVLWGLFSPKSIERITRISLNLCDLIIVPTEKVKKELVLQGIRKPIVVVPYGIDVKNFQIKKSHFLRNKLNIKANEKILLHAGRLGKEKSIDFLIYVFQIVFSKDPKTHLVIVGGGPELLYLKSLSERLLVDKNVHFVGPIEPKKMPLVYNSADLFIFSSKTETQGLVILEAMASGLPVVAVLDSALENVIENKKTGMFVDKDTNVFAEIVLKLLKNKKERDRLSKNAIKKTISFCDDSVTKLENVYKRVVN